MISAFVGHLVGDYILQNNWMASNKKKSSVHCAVHCAIWSACVAGFALWPIWTLVPLFVTHFIQDRTKIIAWWMDGMGQKEFRTGIYSPWSEVVVDNVWHILTIWCIWRIVG
jgi:hypothetical protein